jgi:hypothetical protein
MSDQEIAFVMNGIPWALLVITNAGWVFILAWNHKPEPPKPKIPDWLR